MNFITSLPAEKILEIFSHLDGYTLARCLQVSKLFNEFIHNFDRTLEIAKLQAEAKKTDKDSVIFRIWGDQMVLQDLEGAAETIIKMKNGSIVVTSLTMIAERYQANGEHGKATDLLNRAKLVSSKDPFMVLMNKLTAQ